MALNLALSFLVLFLFVPLAYSQNPIKDIFEQATHAYNTKDYEKAVELYTQITKMVPNFAPAYDGLGLAVKELSGNTEEAAIHFHMAMAQDPKYVPAYENLGRMYYTDQNFDKAEEYLLKALKLDPGAINAKIHMAWIYLLARSKPTKAIVYFKDINQVQPTPATYYGLGLAYFADNQREKALEMITTLRKMKSEDYASRLEKAVRETRRVNLAQSKPQKQASPAAGSPSAQTAGSPAQESPNSGVKVRLRGKLSDI